MSRNLFRICCCFIAMSFLLACGSDYTPKPRGFFRIAFPEKKYQQYRSETCPFTFDYPVYAEVIHDEDPGAEPCWLNIDYHPFRARLHLSYKEVHGNIRQFMEDSRTMAYKHTIKANAINEEIIYSADSSIGVWYDIEGNAASAVQFFLTDSSKHFLRGALYFPVAPQSDSLAPVVDFIGKDIRRMIRSFRWN